MLHSGLYSGLLNPVDIDSLGQVIALIIMAAVPGSQPKLPAGKGCFKCGKTGHWSRDCTAAPSEWVARGPTQAGASASVQPQESQPLQDLGGQLQVPVAAGKRKRQKPKLTVEHLKERHGIAEVFHTFPKKFKQNFKGHGHEVGQQRCSEASTTNTLRTYVSCPFPPIECAA